MSAEGGPEGQAAFWSLLEAHRAQLYRQSMRLMGGHRADAEDALSTATLKALRHYTHSGHSIDNVRAWLARVLHNVCMDEYRRRQRRLPVPLEQDRIAAAGPAVEQPERAAVNENLAAELGAVVTRLPDALRRPFLMRFAQDMSYRDIAAALDITYDNTRKRVQLARAELRQLLEGNPHAAGLQGPPATRAAARSPR